MLSTRVLPLAAVLLCLACALLLPASSVSAQDGPLTCAPFQLFETPTQLNDTNKCQAFKQNACCGAGIAARAYNWAKEDDGCGVVTGPCLQLLTELACHTNCAPNMTLAVTTGVPGGRPAICRSWAASIYNACGVFQWCTTSQAQVSTCTFLQTSSTRVRTGNGRYTGVVTTRPVGAKDTCTNVDDLTLNEFARKVLEVEVIVDGQGPCNSPLAQPNITRSAAYSTTGGGASFSITGALVAIALVASGFSL